jgi:hypothetical protein
MLMMNELAIHAVVALFSSNIDTSVAGPDDADAA